jgi:hypothetical protein
MIEEMGPDLAEEHVGLLVLQLGLELLDLPPGGLPA